MTDREPSPAPRKAFHRFRAGVRRPAILAVVPWLLAEEEKIPLDRLDGATRSKVLAALAGLVILGLSMMALTWLGARVTRRYMNPMNIRRAKRRAGVQDDDWASKPLISSDDPQDE